METISNFQITDKLLGCGGFSEVYLGYCNKRKEYVAIKKISLMQTHISKQQMIDRLDLEIKLMRTFNHVNIVKIYDVFKTDTHWYILMEYCNYGTMNDVISYNEYMIQNKIINFNREINSMYYLNQIKNALQYIINKGYVHRDIKPTNILLMKQNCNILLQPDNSKIIEGSYGHENGLIVKLADFGLAKYCNNDKTLFNTMCGSPLYMAPEIFIVGNYTSQADLWSYGIVMYQLLYGKYPYADDIASIDDLLTNIKQKNIIIDTSKNFSNECYELLLLLLIKNPQHRLNWQNFFNHVWFTKWEKEKSYQKIPILNKNISQMIIDPNQTKDIELKQNDINLFSPQPENDPRSLPIQIEGKRNNISINFSNSPLWHSNLSKMNIDIDNTYKLNKKKKKYLEYPSSYPPN